MEQQQETKKALPTFLIVLSIISFVAIGLTSLYDFMLLIMKAMPEEQLTEAIDLSKQNITEMQLGNADDLDISSLYRMIDNCAFHLLFNIIELIGIIMLLTRRVMGLHFYIASQIGIAYITYLTFPASSLLSILLCLLWSTWYWRASKMLEQ